MEKELVEANVGRATVVIQLYRATVGIGLMSVGI
jgi:hypothetical protein